jgi:hypothetical protein
MELPRRTTVDSTSIVTGDGEVCGGDPWSGVIVKQTLSGAPSGNAAEFARKIERKNARSFMFGGKQNTEKKSAVKHGDSSSKIDKRAARPSQHFLVFFISIDFILSDFQLAGLAGLMSMMSDKIWIQKFWKLDTMVILEEKM